MSQRPFAVPETLEEEPLSTRFVRGAFWSLVGALAARAFSMAADVAMARLLGNAGFGELGMVQNTMGLFGVFAGFGLGLTSTKHVAEFKRADPVRAGRIIALTCAVALACAGLMAGLCVALAPWLAARTINAPHLAPALRAGALLLFVSALAGSQIGVLTGFEAFRAIARVNFFQGLVTLPVAVVFVYWAKLPGAIAAITISAGVGLILAASAVAKECRALGIRPVLDAGVLSEARILWHFSLPAMLSGVLVAPVTWAASAILVNQPHGYCALGVVNAAERLRMLVLCLPELALAPLLPILSGRSKRDEKETYSNTVDFSVLLACSAALPLVFLAASCPKLVMGLFGKDYESSPLTLQWTMLSAAINAIGFPVGAILASKSRMWLGLAINGLWSGAFFALAVLFVPRYGGAGLAASKGLAYLVLLAATLWYLSAVDRHALGRFRFSLVFALVALMFSVSVGASLRVTVPYALLWAGGGSVLFLGALGRIAPGHVRASVWRHLANATTKLKSLARRSGRSGS